MKVLDTGLAESILSLEKIRCAACVWLCDHHLQRVFGIDDVQINYVTLKAIVRFDPQKITLPKILYEVQRIGYLAWPYEPRSWLYAVSASAEIYYFVWGSHSWA